MILFVESALTSDVPWDVQAWAESHRSFPNDSTGDQFFDYGQFEAYRRLGEHQMSTAVDSPAWAAACAWRSGDPWVPRPWPWRQPVAPPGVAAVPGDPRRLQPA